MTVTATKTATTAPAFLDAVEVADLFKCSTRHIYRLLDAGRFLPPTKLGALNRWSRDQVDRWIAAGCPDPASWLEAAK